MSSGSTERASTERSRAAASTGAAAPTVRKLPTQPPSSWEIRALEGVQATVGSVPGAVTAARAMSHFGEHALGWVAVAGVGAVVDRSRRRQWAAAAIGAVGAHAASIVVKRIVRRPRPDDPAVAVGVSTPSKLSFPSSHATSTTAAAVLMGRLTGLPLPAVIVPPMLLSRLILGVHYPTDVLAGSALGAASAGAVLRFEKRRPEKRRPEKRRSEKKSGER